MWNPKLLWLHVASDILIGLSYFYIAFTLIRLVRLCRDQIPFHGIFLAFGTFILACGCTHLLGVVVLWRPLYWLEGDIKLGNGRSVTHHGSRFAPLPSEDTKHLG